MKKFHLSDVLSITTGVLLSNSGMEGIYKILKYMTSCDIYTHQIPEAITECQPQLLTQHPELKNVNCDNIAKTELKQWIDEQVKIYGEYLNISPLSASKSQ